MKGKVLLLSVLAIVVGLILYEYEFDGVDIRVKISSKVLGLMSKYIGLHRVPDEEPVPFRRDLIDRFNAKAAEDPDGIPVQTIDLEFPALDFQLNHTSTSESTMIGARLFIPEQAHQNPEIPLGVLIWFHGGGFVLGSSFDVNSDATGRDLANTLQKYVLYVEYRLAPEYPFPYGLEDCYSSLIWISSLQAESKDFFEFCKSPQLCDNKRNHYAPIDFKRILIGGDSAGGNFAVQTLHLWNRRKVEKESELESIHYEEFNQRKFYHNHGFHSVSSNEMDIVGLVAVYPSLFVSPIVPSTKQFESTYFVSKPVRTFFRYSYVLDDDEHWKDDDDEHSHRKRSFSHPYIAGLLDEQRLEDFPPTIIILAEIDPLLDEGRMLYTKLKEKNRIVQLQEFPCTCHGFFSFTFLPEAHEAVEVIQSFIQKYIN